MLDNIHDFALFFFENPIKKKLKSNKQNKLLESTEIETHT